MSKLVGLDTNIVARYYVAGDEADEATPRQSGLARKLIESGRPLMVAKTVILELEWVLSGYYKFNGEEVGRVFAHLASLPNVQLEDREAVERAMGNHAAVLDFADALHHASYGQCSDMASFGNESW